MAAGSDSSGITRGPYCGYFGCSASADVRIDHPEHGERVVCADHADEYEVVDDV